MKGQIKLNTNLVGHISTGGTTIIDNGDHFTAPIRGVQNIQTTSAEIYNYATVDNSLINTSTAMQVSDIHSMQINDTDWREGFDYTTDTETTFTVNSSGIYVINIKAKDSGGGSIVKEKIVSVNVKPNEIITA